MDQVKQDITISSAVGFGEGANMLSAGILGENKKKSTKSHKRKDK